MREKETFPWWFLPRKADMFMTWLNTQLAGGASPAILGKYKVCHGNSRMAKT